MIPARHAAQDAHRTRHAPPYYYIYAITDDSPTAAKAGQLDRQRITHADRQHTRHDPGQDAISYSFNLYLWPKNRPVIEITKFQDFL